MTHPSQLPVEAMQAIFARIQEILWLEPDAAGDFWNGDKDWDAETVEEIAEVLAGHGIRPEENSAVPIVCFRDDG